MARGGSRASRRMGRNARAVSKLLRGGKRKRGFAEPKATGTKKVSPLRKQVLKGKKIRKRSLRSDHRKAISVGMQRYWRNKRKRAQQQRKLTLNRASSMGIAGGTHGN